MPAVRRGLAILVACAGALSLAACGSDERPGTAGASDPGREVMTAFVAAAADGDAEVMWALLSQPSRRRVGPTLAAFEKGEAVTLRRKLASFAKGRLPVLVSENIDFRFGIVALSRGRHAYAVPLRLEGDVWRVELPGPLTIEISGPPPGSRGKFADQVGVEVHGRGPTGVTAIWVDGITLQSRSFAGRNAVTVFANLEGGLEPGRHTATAFASRGSNAAAAAWTFIA